MRYWTVAEADAELPRVTEVVNRVRQVAAAVHAATGNGKAQPAAAGVFEAAVAELAEDGIVLRDADRGLIDFPAISPSGREYWLCWVVGESAVAWWHWPEDGFAGRTPIAEPPA